MKNLLKMEKYHLLRNRIYWGGSIGIFLIGLFTAETYVEEVLGPAGGAAASLSDIFNGMVYDSTFLLIFVACILALILGQEFSSRTITQEVSAGHTRKSVFATKVISYLAAFNCMAVLYPIAGCVREYARFGLADTDVFFYNVIKGILYSFAVNSTILLIAVFMCCYFKCMAKAVAATAITTFILSLYLGYGMMLHFPVSFLPAFQIREVVSSPSFIVVPALFVSVIWILVLLALSWKCFCKCDLK